MELTIKISGVTPQQMADIHELIQESGECFSSEDFWQWNGSKHVLNGIDYFKLLDSKLEEDKETYLITLKISTEQAAAKKDNRPEGGHGPLFYTNKAHRTPFRPMKALFHRLNIFQPDGTEIDYED